MPELEPWEPSPEERQSYLNALAAGQPRPVAARVLNKDLTGTMFRRLMSRDPEFAELVEAAEREGSAEYRELLEAQVQRRALRLEERSTKALEIALATEMPEKYGWLRRNGGSEMHGSREQYLEALTSLLRVRMELLTEDEVATLLRLIEKGQGKQPESANGLPVLEA